MTDITTTNESTVKDRKLQVVVFRLGQEEYGLHIDQIKEVVLTPAITKMPQTPSYVKGVANIRGNVIAIFDLEERFKIKGETISDYRYTLVVESDDLKLGLLLNEVPNTITIHASDLDESIGLINDQSTESNYIKGIIKSDKRLIILIDIYQVVDHTLADAIRRNPTVAA